MANSIPLIYEIDVQIPSAGNITKKLQQQLAGADQSADALSKSILQVGESAEKTSQEVAQSSVGLQKFSRSAQQVNKSNRSLTAGSSQATNTLTNFNRVVQDAPFGLIGIANNIDPLVSSFQGLSKSSGGARGAIKSLVGSLAGPQGVLFAVSLVTSALIAFGPEIKELFTGPTKEATDANKNFVDSLLSVRDRISELQGLTDFESVRERQIVLLNRQNELQEKRTRLEERYNELTSKSFDNAEKEEQRVAEIVRLEQRRIPLARQQDAVKKQLEETTKQLATQDELSRDAQVQKLRAQEKEEKQLEKNLAILEKQNENFDFDLGLEEDANKIAQDFSAAFNRSLASSSDKIRQLVGGVDLGIDDDLANQGQKAIEAREQQLLKERQIEQQRRDIITGTENLRITAAQNGLNAVTSLLQTFGVKNKAISLAVLAVEKGLAIARVVVDTTQKVAQATTQAAVLAANPFTAPLAVNALAQVGAIKAAGATAIAAIAAQGLAEAGGIIAGGGGGAGGGVGGAGGRRGGGGASTGFSVGDSRNTREAQRSNVNARDNREPRIEFRPRLTLDERGLATSVRRGESKLAETETRVG